MPCVYYGDEIGMEGYHDPFNRQPYPWGMEDKAVLTFFKDASGLRTEYPMLKDAYYKGVSHDKGLFVFDRFNDSERMRVVVNMSDKPYELSLEGGRLVSFVKEEERESVTVAPKDFALIYFKY
jgi:glycosidase